MVRLLPLIIQVAFAGATGGVGRDVSDTEDLSSMLQLQFDAFAGGQQIAITDAKVKSGQQDVEGAADLDEEEMAKVDMDADRQNTTWWPSRRRRRCFGHLENIPATIDINFDDSNDYTKWVKDCGCHCNGNANEFSGGQTMSGTQTKAIWQAKGWSIFNGKCSCAKTIAENPRWKVKYHDGQNGWNNITPGTCNTGITPADDDKPDNTFYLSCFAHDLCLLEHNDQFACAYLLPAGLAALVR